SRPSRRVSRIGFRRIKSFLIADECAKRSIRAVRTVFPTGFPEDFIPAEKSHVNARIACGLYIGAVRSRPIFVMTRRYISLVIQDQASAASGIDTGGIRDVVHVLLET